uniref:Uncharacterized protein n=1 Tax=Rhodococcus sp. NS1 TaxID=402236 RepID=A0A097SPP0_9NOCA|nr:hypothetical protein LRS1606.55 [Rhodococcus sp. NS1]
MLLCPVKRREGRSPRDVDTSSYAAVASLADRCSYSIGQIWPRVECLLLVLYRVIQRKTAARASPALFQRFRPCNVSRFNVAFSDSAAALSADVPTAPRDVVTPNSRQRSANSADAYWASSTGRCNTGLLQGA